MAQILKCVAVDKPVLVGNDPNCMDLSVREINDLSVLQGLDKLRLKKLFLNNNLIEKLSNFHGVTLLVELNLSFNAVLRIERLDCLVNLVRLNLAHNRICVIENLDTMVRLRELDLSENRIVEIKGLDPVVNLEHLDLSNNSIQTIQNLETLTQIKVLNLGCNEITTWQNMEKLTKLTTLDLSGNQISVFNMPTCLPNLKILDLSRNSIHTILVPTHEAGIAPEVFRPLQIYGLEELWLSDNLICDWREVANLRALTTLSAVSLKDNPFSQGDRGRVMYGLWITRYLPHVKKIDGIAWDKEIGIDNTTETRAKRLMEIPASAKEPAKPLAPAKGPAKPLSFVPAKESAKPLAFVPIGTQPAKPLVFVPVGKQAAIPLPFEPAKEPAKPLVFGMEDVKLNLTPGFDFNPKVSLNPGPFTFASAENKP